MLAKATSHSLARGFPCRSALMADWKLARGRKPLRPIAPLEQPMLVHVVKARAVGGFRVWLEFNDRLEGGIDLADELDGEVFVPLRDATYFASFRLEGVALT